MEQLRDHAFYHLLWRSLLTAICTTVLIATLSADLATAVLICANVALLFSLALIAWTNVLSEERLIRSTAWRMLPPNQRPAGPGGRRGARKCLTETTLRFAEGGSAVAIVLSASALLLDIV